MSLQWYPGHMKKARRIIAEAVPDNDVIIEVLDARMPAASSNPLVTELRRHKPCLKVLTKSDLADPTATAAWLRALVAQPVGFFDGRQGGATLAVALRADRPAEAKRQIAELCQQLAPNRSGPGKMVRAMVLGIPNVGKSTLVNALAGRSVTNVADKPGVTKARQYVVLKNGTVLSDLPGLLWPNIEDGTAALRLALGGALPDSILDYESVATFGAAFLLEHYPAALCTRYKLEAVPPDADALLRAIGQRRGGLRKGGHIDMYKAADVLLHEFRAGLLGRISLEWPPGATVTG